MRRHILGLALLLLFLLPLAGGPVLSSMPQLVKNSHLSEDDDISPQSILSFSETLPDDVSFFPDGTDYQSGAGSGPDIYAESFTDVSDWTERTASGLGAGDRGFGTDGDVGEFWIVCTDTGDEVCNWKTIFDTPLSKYSYLEVRGWRESASAAGAFYIVKADLTTLIYVSSVSSTANTYKFYLAGLSGIEALVYGFAVQVNDDPNSVASGNYSVFYDYVRVWEISETEAGWQHDCSSTDNTSAVVSDGDLIELGGWPPITTTEFYTDSTAEQTCIDPDYYPFLAFNVTGAPAAYTVRVQEADDDWVNVFSSSTTTGIRRANIHALTSSDIRVIEFDGGAGGYLDWVKMYSIANFTVTQANLEVTDYLYVASNAVVCTISGGSEYFVLNHDPALSLAVATYNVWNVTLADTNPTSGNDYAYAYTTTLSGGSRTYAADEWRGHYDYGGTLTDCAFILYQAGTLRAIKFIDGRTWNNAGTAFLYMDMPNWHLVGIASLWFYLPIAMTTLNFWFILVGLIMIPVSTLYLVRGGRDELSSDKVFFALVIFFVGLAFFIGGIV